MFFQDHDGAYLRVDDIKWMGALASKRSLPSGEAWLTAVGMKNGNEILVGEVDRGLIERHPQHVLPVTGPTFVLHYDDETGNLYKETVIGWAVTAVSGTCPITLEGIAEPDSYDVLLPDGRVVRPLDQTWESLDKYLEDKRG